ncbi:protein yippee-like 3 [Cryptococcus neoformans]|nr:protein yippee-like 3 [Cryptococcus neoformans var. grubii]OWZ62393.1 protein yippee-like 3 [Cryptococcus neoformans var. grubii]
MRTGRHTVRDIYCRVCHTTLGWKYDFAFEHDQKYKEGKYILEREMITEKPERRDIISGKPRIEEIPIREILARV